MQTVKIQYFPTSEKPYIFDYAIGNDGQFYRLYHGYISKLLNKTIEKIDPDNLSNLMKKFTGKQSIDTSHKVVFKNNFPNLADFINEFKGTYSIDMSQKDMSNGDFIEDIYDNEEDYVVQQTSLDSYIDTVDKKSKHTLTKPNTYESKIPKKYFRKIDRKIPKRKIVHYENKKRFKSKKALETKKVQIDRGDHFFENNQWQLPHERYIDGMTCYCQDSTHKYIDGEWYKLNHEPCQGCCYGDYLYSDDDDNYDRW